MNLCGIYVSATPTPSIQIENARWNIFPLRVCIQLNEWSRPSYAIDIREALDMWVKCIWSYTQSLPDRSLRKITYTLYIQGINRTYNDIYDVLIEFTTNYISTTDEQNTIGYTSFKFNPISHEPIQPIHILLTTFNGSASDLLIKNITMHEFGHAIGIGHANSHFTTDGIELMSPSNDWEHTVFPSSLDIYCLWFLYQDNYGKTIDLPSNIQYVKIMPLVYGDVTIVSMIGNLSAMGVGKYSVGTSVELKTFNIYDLSNLTRLKFLYWNFTDTQTSISLVNTSFTVMGDTTIIANWQREYYVNVTSDYTQNYTKSGYFPEGSFMSFSIDDVLIDYGNNTRMIFCEFYPDNLFLSKPVTVKAIWEKEYYVTITSIHGNLNRREWIKEDNILNLSLPNFLLSSDWTAYIGIGYRLAGWMVNDHIVNNQTLSLKINNPLSVIAIWEVDYSISIHFGVTFTIIIISLLLSRKDKIGTSYKGDMRTVYWILIFLFTWSYWVYSITNYDQLLLITPLKPDTLYIVNESLYIIWCLLIPSWIIIKTIRYKIKSKKVEGGISIQSSIQKENDLIVDTVKRSEITLANLLCPKCGAMISPKYKFCSKCGTTLYIRRCLNCGSQVDNNDSFCPHCGTRLTI